MKFISSDALKEKAKAQKKVKVSGGIDAVKIKKEKSDKSPKSDANFESDKAEPALRKNPSEQQKNGEGFKNAIENLKSDDLGSARLMDSQQSAALKSQQRSVFGGNQFSKYQFKTNEHMSEEHSTVSKRQTQPLTKPDSVDASETKVVFKSGKGGESGSQKTNESRKFDESNKDNPVL